jgi:glycosyltransferase involved in cell wall biosynthesis
LGLKISIITVTRNSAATLIDTLRSVALQHHPEVEHIIVDGASEDNTTEIVRLHGQHVTHLICEPDDGTYDAMNKGAALATGSVIAFLNADDWYADPGVLGWVSERFDAGADLVYGDLAFVNPQQPFTIRRVWRDRQHAPQDFFAHGWHPAHPATFIRTELFRSLGGFDTRWRIAADYAFLARAICLPELRLAHIERRLVNMRLGGASTAGIAAVIRANRECADALTELGISSPWRIIRQKIMTKCVQKLCTTIRQSDNEGKPPWRP